MNTLLNVSYPPHVADKRVLSSQLHQIILGLVPAIIAGFYVYGLDGVKTMTAFVFFCMLFDGISRYAFRKDTNFYDGSTVLTGVLLAAISPAGLPLWLVVLGSFFAVVLGKQLFGGIGSAPFNPVLIGWAILEVSWGHITDYDINLANISLPFSSDYPIAAFKTYGQDIFINFRYEELFLGHQAGGIMASQVVFLLIGGIYAVIRGIYPIFIPVTYLLGIFIGSLILGTDPLFHLVAGPAVFAAFFLATDYSSSPNTIWGMLLYGFLGGILTMLIRVFGSSLDGAVFALLIMNIFTPLFDRIRPKIITREADNA